MTLPTTWIFPTQGSANSAEDNGKFSKDLIIQLQSMYEQLAQGVNGDIKANSFIKDENWTPTLNGSTAGTFTYVNQVGWVLRKGIMVDLWFDIEWNATTAAGNLYLELPYKVAKSSQMPFVGTLQPSSFNYGGFTNLFINAIPNTYRGEIWGSRSGAATNNLAVQAIGRLIGHIRYMGVGNEQA